MELLEALKNAAQDVKHEKTGYFWLTFETLRTKMNQSNEQFRNFLLPLLGDKDHEKILEIVAKVEKTNRRTHGKQEGQRLLPHTRFFVAIIVAVLVIPGPIVLNVKEIWESLRENRLDPQSSLRTPSSNYSIFRCTFCCHNSCAGKCC